MASSLQHRAVARTEELVRLQEAGLRSATEDEMGGRAIAYPRGQEATTPREIPWAGWRDIALRVKDQFTKDNLSLVAAGVAFYGLLSLVPALVAAVTIYGLVADPATIEQQIGGFTALPSAMRDLVVQQMQRIAATSPTALGVGLAVSLGFALWSASKGTKSLITALNIAYNEEERRGFFKLNGLALLFTLGMILAGLLGLAVIAGVPALLRFLGLGAFLQVVVTVLPWVVLAAVVYGLLASVYRYGPSRSLPAWAWVRPGSLMATVLWGLVSVGFSVYVANLGNYNETYGSLGAVVVLLMWFWLSVLVVLLGAEVNAEMERQTRRDTTDGPERPIGERGARVADSVGHD